MFHVKHRSFASFLQSDFKTQQSRPFGRLVLQGNVYLFYQTTAAFSGAVLPAGGLWRMAFFVVLLCAVWTVCAFFRDAHRIIDKFLVLKFFCINIDPSQLHRRNRFCIVFMKIRKSFSTNSLVAFCSGFTGAGSGAAVSIVSINRSVSPTFRRSCVIVSNAASIC